MQDFEIRVTSSWCGHNEDGENTYATHVQSTKAMSGSKGLRQLGTWPQHRAYGAHVLRPTNLPGCPTNCYSVFLAEVRNACLIAAHTKVIFDKT